MSRWFDRPAKVLWLIVALKLIGLMTPVVALAQDNFFEVYRSQYIVRRAFPDSSISDSLRARAYRSYREAQVLLGPVHIEPTWSDSLLDIGPATGPCVWRSVGPTNINGRVTGIAFDSERKVRVFATTVGGIWRSLDDGRRWHRVSDNLGMSIAAPPATWGCVAVNPVNIHEVFAGSGDPNYGVSIYPSGRDSSAGQGIWRSINDGDPGTWVKVSPPSLDGKVIFRLRIDPNTSNKVYAATSAGIWVGTHGSGGSITWSRLGSLDAQCSDVVVDFTSVPRVYAGVCKGTSSFGKGLWKWDGAWHQRMGGILSDPIGAIALAIDPTNASVIIAKIARSDDGSHHGLYRTTDAARSDGPHWSLIPGGSVLDDSPFGDPSPDSYCWYNNTIEIDPTNAARMLAGGKFLYLSTDGGNNWIQVSNGGNDAFAHLHDDQHAIAFDPSHGDAVVGNDGGLDRSVDLPSPGSTTTDWHWEHISHGMTTGQFYTLASTQRVATAVAGGSQDNGDAVTFGNRSWYKINDCDAWSIAMDAGNACTLYETDNGNFVLRTNPVAGSTESGWTASVTPPTNVTLLPPFAADPVSPLHAICAGMNKFSKQFRVCQTIDGSHWTETSDPMPDDDRISCLTIDPSSSFGRFYAGLLGPSSATIWSGSGSSWIKDATGLPNDKSPNAIVVDVNSTPKRIYAALGGSSGGAVAMSTTDGQTWQVLGVSGIASLGPVMGLAIDPSNPNTLYAATMVGVLSGTFQAGATPSVHWVPFGDNLPDAVDVSDIWVNPGTKVLSIATMGYGLFQRDITPDAQCGAASVLVRDNVYDRGVTPSPFDEADPERPVRIGTTDYFEADPDHHIYWWTSTDIRVEVPGPSVPAPNAVPLPGAVQHTVPSGEPLHVDHVEMESCPVIHANCAAGTMIDVNAIRGKQALVHVQVTNQGYQPLTNVRVLALWADAGAGLPLLPADLWSTRFPGSSGTCPAWPLSPSDSWHAVDENAPCFSLATVNPDVPEVATFAWDVPAWAGDHSCMVAIVEAQNDPIDPAIRSSNEQRVWVLVPNERHVAQRNLHIIDESAAGAPLMSMTQLQFWNPTPDTTGIDLVVTRGGLPAGQELCVYLPRIKGMKFEGAKACVLKPGAADWTRPLWGGKTRAGGAFAVTKNQGVFHHLPVAPGRAWTIGLHFGKRAPSKAPPTTGWCTILARQGQTVLGGSTYLLRPPAPRKKAPSHATHKNVAPRRKTK